MRSGEHPEIVAIDRVTTAQLLSGIAAALGLVAFVVITYVDALNSRDEEPLRDFEDFLTRQEIGALTPIEPLEGARTPEQRELAQAIEFANTAEIEGLKANKIALLKESEKVRERQADRRRFILAGQLATAGTFIVGLIALFA